MQDRQLNDELLANHRHIESLLDGLLNCLHTGNPWVAQKAWAELESALLGHMEAEEVVILPAFQAADPDHAERIREDHRIVRSELAELGVGVELHRVTEDVATRLTTCLREHAELEERTMYPWAARNLPQDALDSIVATVRKLRAAAARAKP